MSGNNGSTIALAEELNSELTSLYVSRRKQE
jgi:hypothetical protein